MRRPPLSDEAGYSLVELLIAMVIMSLGVVAVLGALRVGIDSGRIQRNLAVHETTLTNFAEHIKSNVTEAYLPCADASQYGVGFTAPEGTTVSVVEVSYWDGEIAASPLSFIETCPETDTGTQLIRLSVQTTEDEALLETLIVKRQT